METHWSSNLQILERELIEDLEAVLFQEDFLWQQRVNTDWSMLGDRNTSFFHAKGHRRARKKKIHGLYISNGEWSEDQKALCHEASLFFKDVYTGDTTNGLPYFIRDRFPPLPVVVHQDLERPVSNDEINAALFSMAPNRAHGPDGVPNFFS
ncbi:hypothetical protein Scep_026167 [Stephania cephalantha]|uniref:Uncharacterized protein n=1 Tax=Stephania cephalantha TaxID=152367 RepID=A0AAP0EQ78_9MAGN